MSFVSAPPREQVHVVSAVYGSLSGPVTASRARLWILLENGDPTLPLARICRNDQSGQPFYTDLGKIATARSSHKRLEIHTDDGQTHTLIEAPCVCGAGAAGGAGPIAGRYDQVRVRTDTLEWLETV